MHAAVLQTKRPGLSFPVRVISGRRYVRKFHAQGQHFLPRRTGPFEPANSTLDQAPISEAERGSEEATKAPRAVTEVEQNGHHEGPRRIVEALNSRAIDRDGRGTPRLERFPPVHIPKWFQNENIKLAEDPLETKPKASYNCTLTVKGQENARSLASIAVPLTAGDGFRALQDAQLWAAPAAPSTSEDNSVDKEQHKDHGWSPPFWIQAEIQAAIISALSIARVGHLPFPAARSSLVLHLPVDGGVSLLTDQVKDIATSIGADVIQLGAQDLAEIGSDYLGESLEPLSQSLRTLGFETHQSQPIEELMEQYEEDLEEDQQVPGAARSNQQSVLAQPLIAIGDSKGIAKSIQDLLRNIKPVTRDIGRSMDITRLRTEQMLRSSARTARLEDLKLSFLLAALAESNELKRANSKQSRTPDHQNSNFFTDSCPTQSKEIDVSAVINSLNSENTATFKLGPRKAAPESVINDVRSRKTILLIEDFKEIFASQVGQSVLVKLSEIVMERRRNGQNIMIVGVTSSTELTPDKSIAGIRMLQAEYENGPERTIVVVPATEYSHSVQDEKSGTIAGGTSTTTGINEDRDSEIEEQHIVDMGSQAQKVLTERASNLDDDEETTRDRSKSTIPSIPAENAEENQWDKAHRERTERINMRHIRDMLRRIDPSVTEPAQNLPFYSFVQVLNSKNRGWLGRALSHEETHRICMTTLGLRPTRIPSPEALAHQINLAMTTLRMSDAQKFAFASAELEKTAVAAENEQLLEQHGDPMKAIRASCNEHEKKLLGGVIDKNSIRTTFADVHAPTESIESLKMLTSLSLLRPDAFRYGVLATDKIPGLLLYGPPGTGKTLLAKAVARESGATVLEVSGSEVNDMYVGEGEKNVKAIFTLARKLSPCVVFIDEADAIFRSRSGPGGGGGGRAAHREIINQFLREWDGMDDLSVFIMVATNRPFDLDDAVLRRLPRRLLVDLPMERDREAIFTIHLKDEMLEPDVSVAELAARTPLYSGSDIKNLCVAAALACVREENELAVGLPAGAVKYPARRRLAARHFDSAVQDISASVSEDMGSLAAIRKFDEQYGDRRGRRKRTGLGFAPVGAMDEVKEELARVRA